MTAHQLRVCVTVTTVHAGQDFGVVGVGADLAPSPSVSCRVYTAGSLEVPEPLGLVGVNRTCMLCGSGAIPPKLAIWLPCVGLTAAHIEALEAVIRPS